MKLIFQIITIACLLTIPALLISADGDVGEPYDITTLYLVGPDKLDREPITVGVHTINDNAEWETLECSQLHGDLDYNKEASIHITIVNKAMLEVRLRFEIRIDHDNDGIFEALFDFDEVFIPASQNPENVKINLVASSNNGHLSNLENGNVKFKVRQVSPCKGKVVKLQFTYQDYIVLPYIQKTPYAIASMEEEITTCEGRNTTFNGSGSIDPNGDNLTYEWDFNAINDFQVEAEGMEVIYVFNKIGSYIVTLRVYDGSYYDTDTVTVNVEETEPPHADAGKDFSVNRREVFTLDGSDSLDPNGDVLNFTWEIAGILWYGEKVQLSLQDSGTYIATLTVTDGDFIRTDNVSITVNPNIVPQANPVLDSKEILASPIFFDGSGSTDPDGDVLEEYLWDFGDGNTSYGAIVNHTYMISGDVNVKLTVYDGMGHGSNIITITIPENKPPEGGIGSPMYLFDNRQFTFYAEDVVDPEGLDVSIEWYMGGGGNTLYGPVVNHSFEIPGIFIITMTMIDELGGINEEKMSIEVLDSELYCPETVTINGNYSAIQGVPMGYFHEIVEITGVVGGLPQVTIHQIPEGGARYYKLQLENNTIYSISVDVIEGGNIDIILVTEENKNTYSYYNLFGKEKKIDWEEYGTDLNTQSFSFEFGGGGIRYLIIGNNGKMEFGAEATGNVIYNITVESKGEMPDPWYNDNNDASSVNDENTKTLLFFAIFVISAIVISVVIAMFMVYNSKKKERKRKVEEMQKEIARTIKNNGETSFQDPGNDEMSLLLDQDQEEINI